MERVEGHTHHKSVSWKMPSPNAPCESDSSPLQSSCQSSLILSMASCSSIFGNMTRSLMMTKHADPAKIALPRALIYRVSFARVVSCKSGGQGSV